LAILLASLKLRSACATFHEAAFEPDVARIAAATLSKHFPEANLIVSPQSGEFRVREHASLLGGLV
jgi:hypothetical protein